MGTYLNFDDFQTRFSEILDWTRSFRSSKGELFTKLRENKVFSEAPIEYKIVIPTMTQKN